MTCFWSLLLILLLCFSFHCKPAQSVRTYPSTPFPTYCTVDPKTGACLYPDPVPNCPLIDRIRGHCSPWLPVTPTVPISLPPLISPAPTEVYDPPPLPVPLGPQVIIVTPPEEGAAPQSPPVYGTPVDLPMPPQLTLPLPSPFGEPQPPFAPAVATMPPEFVGLPVEFPVPDQPPFPMTSEPAPSILPPLLPAEPPAVSELPINIPTPP